MIRKIVLYALALGMPGTALTADTEQFHMRLAEEEVAIQALSDAVIHQEERVLAAQERIRELKQFILDERTAALSKNGRSTVNDAVIAAKLDEKIHFFLTEFFENTAADTEYFLTDKFFDDLPGRYGYLYTLLKFYLVRLHCESNALVRKIAAWENAMKALV